MKQPLDWVSYNGSNIKEYAYRKEDKELWVRFQGGKPNVTYVYTGVTPQRFAQFNVAESKGEYLHHFIKPNYNFRKVIG